LLAKSRLGQLFPRVTLYRIEIAEAENKVYAACQSHDGKQFGIKGTKFSSVIKRILKLVTKHRANVTHFPLEQEQNVIIVPKDMRAAIALSKSKKN
jgi:hypothetical protein